MADNHNIEPLHADTWSNIRSFLARVYNQLVKALNTELYVLPRYILIILDKDLISNAELFDFGVSHTIEDTLKWLLVNMDQTIETRKEDLAGKRAGAVSTTSEPRFVWVAMLRRPDDSMDKKVFALARKFNDILKRVITGNKRSHFLCIEIPLDNINFDHIGNLSQIGKTCFWKCLDTTMKDFDRGKTELELSPNQAVHEKPRNHLQSSYHSGCSHADRTHTECPWAKGSWYNRHNKHHHY